FPKWKLFFVLAVVAWAIVQTVPNFISEAQRAKLKILPPSTIKLWAGLQGGAHLLLRVGFHQSLKKHFDGVLDDIRKNLRKEKIGYIHLGVKMDEKQNPYVTFDLRDDSSIDTAKNVLKKISRDFTVDNSGTAFKVSYSDDVMKAMKKDV